MSLHDQYARVTPWELLFPSEETARAFSAEVAEEQEGRGADAERPSTFLTMAAVDRLARSLEGAEDAGSALQRFGPIAFHALHFTRADRPLYLLSVHASRYLVDGAPSGDPVPPSPAGYLQLPQHLFWADPGSGSLDSVDGIFWTATSHGLLHAMLVTGVRPDRPGVGVITLPEAPLDDAPAWLTIDPRPGGEAFAAALPGAELDVLYGLTTTAEVLQLLARAFAYIDSVPSALVEDDVPGADASPGPMPSSLPWRRIRLSP